MSTRLRAAGLREQATLEDLDLRSPRGLDRALVLSLGSCDWIRLHWNVLISGPTGTSKTYLGSALAHTACREDFSALFVRRTGSLPIWVLPASTGASANSLPNSPGPISRC